MFNHRFNKTEQQANVTFPTTKLKNITCVYCHRQFIVQNVNALWRSNAPLLLACGHPFCNQCVKKHEKDPCPLCGPMPESSSAREDSHPPVNIYVVGLIASCQPAPVYGAEPDISFSQKNSSRSKPESSKEDHCSQCGYYAILRDLDCKMLFCQGCYCAGHAHLKIDEGHRTILLQNSENESLFEEKKCTEHEVLMDYFCENCSFPCCSHCMLSKHRNHEYVSLAKKNAEYLEQYGAAQNKLGETIERIYQAKKKIQRVLIFPEELQKNETIEKSINEHFVQLHGLLQITEKRLIGKLYEQRESLTKNLKDLQQLLDAQESQLQTALTMAISAKDSTDRINLKDVVAKMLKLASDTHCYLVQDQILDGDNIIFHPDLSIKSVLEDHCKLVIPEISSYCLQREDNLPEDYQIEPLPKKSTVSMDNTMCSQSSMMKKAASCQSLYSQRSEIRIENGDSLISVKICYVEHPSNFYVCRESNLGKVAELEGMLDNYTRHNDEVPSKIEQNILYAVKNQVSGKWYRGRVTAINSIPEQAETFEVCNIDKGGVEYDVPRERMRCISEHLKTIGPMVMHCSLYDIVPKNGAWSNEACEVISKLQALNETVKMHIENANRDMYFVDLLLENSKRIVGSSTSSIRDALIFLGLATYNSSHQLLRSTPDAVRRFFNEDLAINYYHDVTVTHVESPHCIYVQKTEGNSLYLQNMMIEINAYYKDKTKSDDGIIHVPEIGLTCAAEDTDGTWYRAIISNETTQSRMVTVTLVDFGRTITVNFDKIRTLHERFMASTAQAIKTMLADINPVDAKWNQDCKKLMSEHFVNPCVRVFAYESNPEITTVSLIASSGINMAALLVSKGFAISTGLRSSGVVEAPLAPPVKKKGKSKVRNNRTMRKRKQKHATMEKKLNPRCQEKSDPFKLRVKILRVVSPNMIYVANPENDESYTKLVAEMQRFYKRNEGRSKDDEWRIDHQCAVYSASDGTFCRGKIIGFNNPKEAQVFLYDLTYTESIPVANLQPLASSFWETPTYAIKVKLAGLNPCGGSSEWLSASCQTLKDLIAENQNCNFYISTIQNLVKDHLEVELWVEQVKIEGPLAPGRKEINSINKMMVSSGMALPIKQNEKNQEILADELKRQILTEQEKSMNKNKMVNGTFQKKEHCDAIDSPRKIDSDDEFSLSDENYSSIIEENETTVSSIKDLPSYKEFKLLPDENIEQTATQWLPADPIEDSHFRAVVTNLNHDCQFYIHSLLHSRDNLNYIEKILAEKYDKMVGTPQDLVWEKGDLCIAQYHSNKKWYRGQVNAVLENGMIEVEFIDYGNIEECEIGTLRKNLTLLEIPRQGTHCVIFGLVPNTQDNKWLTDDLDKIHGALVDHECEITVIERKPDLLEVSLMMLYPRRCDLIKFLCNDLKMDVRMDFGFTNLLSDETNDETTDETANDDDVVVDGYVKNGEYKLFEKKVPVDEVTDDYIEDEEYEAVEQKIPDDIEETPIENDEEIENNGESDAVGMIDNCNHKNLEEGDEIKDDNEDDCEEIVYAQINCSKSSEPTILQTTRNLESTLLGNNEDFGGAENGNNISNPINEDIISGTIDYIHNSEEIDINVKIMNDLDVLDSISLPDTIIGLREDGITTSTPHNHSLEANNNQHKSVVIPEDVTLVEAQISVIGSDDKFLLHVIGNKSSKILSQQRQLYEKMMSDMQAHAEGQPLLKFLDAGELCCAKFSDGIWYRSKVLSNESQPYELGHTLRVYFIDYGNNDIVKSEDIRVLKDEWLEAPCMLICCGLYNICKNPTIDSTEICIKICEFFESQQYTGSEYPRKFYVKIEAKFDDFYEIEMYNDENCTMLIYQPIIDAGLYFRGTDLWA